MRQQCWVDSSERAQQLLSIHRANISVHVILCLQCHYVMCNIFSIYFGQSEDPAPLVSQMRWRIWWLVAITKFPLADFWIVLLIHITGFLLKLQKVCGSFHEPTHSVDWAKATSSQLLADWCVGFSLPSLPVCGRPTQVKHHHLIVHLPFFLHTKFQSREKSSPALIKLDWKAIAACSVN